MSTYYTTTQLANMLGFEIDSLGRKPFADTETPILGEEILYTGYDIFTHDELREMYSELQDRIKDKIDNNVDIFTSDADIRYFETEKFKEEKLSDMVH